MSKSYTSAKMHDSTFAVGIGVINKELSTRGTAIDKAVKSIILEEGSNIVQVTIEDKLGHKVVLDIPLTNFENLRE